MRFNVSGSKVYKIDPLPIKLIAIFVGGEMKHNFPDEVAEALAGDYCDFLNDKYCDKEFNKEWPEINRKERIEYHKNQIKLLENENCNWNEHGNGVE